LNGARTAASIAALVGRGEVAVILACARAALAAGVFAGLGAAPAAAQWLDYATPGLPRTANGAPDLAAPAPRTAEGRPDLSGVWWSADVRFDECAVENCITQAGLPLDQIDIGRSLQDGLPLQPWAAELTAERIARGAADDPHARCLPPNFPRAYSLPQYFKIVQTPGLMLMLHEFNGSYRQIFTDGRPLPEDPHPTWNGYSTGRWEGDELVVETVGFRDDIWLDFTGHPMTDEARVTERFTRDDMGRLSVALTVDDPKAFTEVWTVPIRLQLMADTDLLEEFCLENEQDVELMEEQ
jgi:hypothetical protein